jgi:hypothetical protein
VFIRVAPRFELAGSIRDNVSVYRSGVSDGPSLDDNKPRSGVTPAALLAQNLIDYQVLNVMMTRMAAGSNKG